MLPEGALYSVLRLASNIKEGELVNAAGLPLPHSKQSGFPETNVQMLT